LTVEKQWLFDRKWTQDFTRVRQEFMGQLVRNVRKEHELRSALDLGCGVGYFSKYLSDLGFDVLAIDGRPENAAEGKRRYPLISFLSYDIEDPRIIEIGSRDFVACIGLLYHLENPFRAIRNICSLTGKVLLIETMYAPGQDAIMDLLDEGVAEDQALNYVAFYPSESCFIKMLYRAGFPFVYRFCRLPDDDLFRASFFRKQQRTFLAASKVALALPNLSLAKERFRWAGTDADPWATSVSRAHKLLLRLRTLAAKALKPMLRAVGAKSR
jgi:SAM-dependent methyltransferase